MNRLLLLTLVVLAAGCTTKKPECTIGSLTFADGAPDPTNPCQTCQPAKTKTAFTPLADGTTCGTGKVCGSGTCESGCFIAGAVHAAGADPSNACQTCTPATSTTAWTVASDGAACGDGMTCVADACVAGCFIEGAAQATGVAEPGNACRACNPSVSRTLWSALADGTSCGTLQVCAGGQCARGCIIGGQLQSAGAANPANACETCQPNLSASAWTPVADGAACGTGKVCEHDSCQAGCSIAGSFYTNGLQNPANLCQSCDPSRSTTAWTTTAVLGSSCGTGLICDALGACSADCFIGGIVTAPGANPANACQVCDPTVSTTGYTAAHEGGTCPGGSCHAGTCEQAPTCTINGTVYAAGAVQAGDLNGCAACDPAVSTTAFSPAREGQGCEPVGFCHAGSCQQLCEVEDGGYYADDAGAPGHPCQVCDARHGGFVDRPDGTDCGAGQICGAGACAAGCYVGDAGYAPDAGDPANPCQRCSPAASTHAWTPVADGTACSACNACTAGQCGAVTLAQAAAGPIAGLVLHGQEALYADAVAGDVVAVDLRDGGPQVRWSGLASPGKLALDGDAAYVQLPDGTVRALLADGGEAVVPVGLGGIVDMSIAGGVLYWADPTDGGQVGGLALATGTQQIFAAGAPSAVASDGTYLVWYDQAAQQFTEAYVDGGAITTISAVNVNQLQVVEGEAYWFGTNSYVKYTPLPSDPFTYTIYGVPAGGDPLAIAIDGPFLYAAGDTSGTSAPNAVVKVELSSSTSTALHGPGRVSHIAVDSTCAYFTAEADGGSTLLRTDR